PRSIPPPSAPPRGSTSPGEILSEAGEPVAARVERRLLASDARIGAMTKPAGSSAAVVERRIVVAPGVELHVEVRAGNRAAAPFVLVHGLASNARLWDGVADHLHAAGHTVVVTDQRGHGRSDARPPDTRRARDAHSQERAALHRSRRRGVPALLPCAPRRDHRGAAFPPPSPLDPALALGASSLDPLGDPEDAYDAAAGGQRRR